MSQRALPKVSQRYIPHNVTFKNDRNGLHFMTGASLRLGPGNYWMRLSRIWRILQIEESVIHRGRRPRWITPSEICRILHILRKPNSIIALLFIRNIIFAQTCKLSNSRPFLSLLNETTFFSVNGSIIFDVNDSIICSGTIHWRHFDVNGSIICSGLHFWRHFDVNGSIICSGLHFWRHWFNMTEFLVNSSCLWWTMRVV